MFSKRRDIVFYRICYFQPAQHYFFIPHLLIPFYVSVSLPLSKSFSSCERQLPGSGVLLSRFHTSPPLIDREQSPSSKQQSDAAGACLARNGSTHTYKHTLWGMGLWQRLGRRQSGHCFNDHRLFSSLASPSTSLSCPHDAGALVSSYCGWTIIYWAFGISETQLPKTSCPRNGNGCHLFYLKSFLLWSFDAPSGSPHVTSCFWG